MKKILNIILLLSTFTSFAAIIEVKQDGTGDFTIIQNAMDFAQTGDTVLVWPGTYFENIHFNGKGITLASLVLTTGNRDYRYSTIIDGNQQDRCIKAEESDNEIAIIGFTIQNGFAKNPEEIAKVGGGIFSWCDTYVGDCIIKNNKSVGGGGGIDCGYYHIKIGGCSIFNNHTYGIGGGISIGSEGTVEFDTINKNSIYSNFAKRGCDFSKSAETTSPLVIKLDTATVLFPDTYFYSSQESSGYQIYDLTVDAEHAIITPHNGDLYVNPETGSNSNSGTSWDEPLQSIAWAYHKIHIDSTVKNTIHLANGIYSDTTNNEKFPLNIRPFINVLGQSRDGVILDGNRKTYILRGNNCISDYSFKNMTLQRNNLPTYELGDIWITLAFLYRQNHRFILDSIVFKDAYALEAFAVLSYLHADSSIVRNCVFTDTKGGFGLRTVIGDYGLNSDTCFCGKGDMQYIENTVFNNHQPDYNHPESPGGWAVVTGFDGTNIITNSLFTNNTFLTFSQADIGGTTYLTNCTFYNNGETQGVHAISAFDGDINMYNCISYNNHDIPIRIGAYTPEFMFHSHVNIYNSLVEGGEESVFFHPNCWHHDTVFCHLHYDSTNIDEDPNFLGMWGDPYMIADGSPCINTGTLANLPDFIELPEFDLAGNPRIVGDSIDMGAYEWNETIVGFNEIGPGNKEEKPKLLKALPNPFDWGTYLSVEVKAEVEVEVYDNYGRLVRNILSTTLPEKQEILWYGDDNNGNPLPAGIYHVVMFSGEREVESLKVVKK